MERVTELAELRSRLAWARQQGLTVGLTPTMGALHDGHLEHVRRLRRSAVDLVVVSIFVNPTQFGPGEDFESYPRQLEADEAALAGLAELVWAPTLEVMYPEGEPATTVSVAGLTEVLEGAHRPGHFDGVCTVVSKLLNQVRPDVVSFGRKDFQQLAVIKRMVADLDVPVEILEVPTVREPDGLALSSRNRYLDGADRDAARCLSRALRDAVETARDARQRGERPNAGVLRDRATATLDAEPRARVDYVAVVDPDTLQPPDDRDRGPAAGEGERDGASGRLLVAVAAHVGAARLIDNVVIGDPADEDRLLAATSG